MHLPTPIRNLLVWSAGSLLLWGAIILAFAAQLVFAAGVEWQPSILASIREWAPWGVFTPLVAGLAIRFPFERGRWPISLVIHGLGCAAVVVASGLFSQSLGGREGGPPSPPWRRPGSEWSPSDAEPPHRPGEGRPPRGEAPPRGPGSRQERQLLGARGPMLMRARLNVPVYWIVVSVTTAVLHSRRARERERRSLELSASLAQSRLAALRAQLQPHFLFNALNAIATLVHKDPNAADEMIGNLSDFLRLTLEHSETQELPLQLELDFVQRYLAIEKVRFGARLQIQTEFPPSTLAAQVPVLILQPLIENALKHGIQPKRGIGHLRLAGHREGDHLIITIDDDGVGLATDAREQAGIGLANTRSRLHELHGSHASLSLEPITTGGTRATLRLPFRMTPTPSA